MEHPHIAILGAGPVGLEAALAAHDAGFSFTVYERAGKVGGNVRAWAHVRLFTPWAMNVSPRARRHLAATGWRAPGDDVCPSGAELVSTLLEPVAALPYIAPGLRTGQTVLEVGREGVLKNEEIGTGRRSGLPFRLLVQEAGGAERIDHADAVLDCTGTYHNPNPLGAGGIHAPGERAAAALIERRIPDVLGEPEAWAGRRILLVGAGHSAQTAACDLARLVGKHPGTRVVWAIRSREPTFGAVADDPLPARAALTAQARRLAFEAHGPVRTLRGVVVDALRPMANTVAVTLRATAGGGTSDEGDRIVAGADRGLHGGTAGGGRGVAGNAATTVIEVDRIVSLTGAVGEHMLYRQLQVHECWATQGPMKLAAALLGAASEDCLTQTGHGADALVNPEPEFFLMGSKSYGRNNTFLLRIGWEQVNDVFGMLSARFAARAGRAE